jgi:hypothetical protein
VDIIEPDTALRGMNGWLLVLVLVLLVALPLNLAASVARALPALSSRGVPLAGLLVLRVAVAAVGVAAGIGIVRRHEAARRVAVGALGLSAAVDVFVYLTPYVPHNRMPGDTPLYVAGTVAFHGAWIVYLVRSRRVRNTLA